MNISSHAHSLLLAFELGTQTTQNLIQVKRSAQNAHLPWLQFFDLIFVFDKPPDLYQDFVPSVSGKAW